MIVVVAAVVAAAAVVREVRTVVEVGKEGAPERKIVRDKTSFAVVVVVVEGGRMHWSCSPRNLGSTMGGCVIYEKMGEA